MNFLTQNIDYQVRTLSESTLTGETVECWSQTQTIKGRLRPLSMNEMYYRNKEHTDITHRLYSTFVLNERGRILHNGIYYDVKSVINPMMFDRFYQIDVKVTQ